MRSLIVEMLQTRGGRDGLLKGTQDAVVTCHSAGEWGFQGKGDVSAGRLGFRAGHNCSESHSLPRTEMKQEDPPRSCLVRNVSEIENMYAIKKGVCDMCIDLRGNDFVKTRSGLESQLQALRVTLCHGRR